MLLLIFAAVLFFWLVVGAVQFLICFITPKLRRYSLSAALWWAFLGPCSIAWISLAALVVISRHLVVEEAHFGRFHLPTLSSGMGWSYFILGSVFSMAIATVVARVHQTLILRLTFALFRLYATVISGGIGSVFGWCFSFWVLGLQMRYSWVLAAIGMLAFIGGFGVIAYRAAGSLRGDPPATATWISQEEFEGA